MKILVLKPSSLGDVVQALPVLRLLKAHRPSDRIYWWISADLADLLQGDPDLDGVLLFQRRRWKTPQHWGELVRSLHQIRAHHFDCVIDLQGLARSAFVAWLAGATLTVGVEDWREGAAGLYDVIVPRPSALTHAVDWYLEVLRQLNVPVHWNFSWLPERPAVAARFREKWRLEPARWVIINPGARWANKRWPIENYCRLVADLSREQDLRFAVLGGPGDAPLGAAIHQVNPDRSLDLTGRTSLTEMVEWLRLAEIVVSNDTGPMHVAAALRKPVVSVFGPTEPRRTGPYGQLERALQASLACVPCLSPRCRYPEPLACLHAISPALVSSAVRQQLGLRPG